MTSAVLAGDPGEACGRASRSAGGRAQPDRVPARHDGVVRGWHVARDTFAPGARYVVVTAGCPLRCLYCPDPGGWDETAGIGVRAADVARHALRYRPLFDLTGGGVTLTGGEPLLHPRLVAGLVRACREAGVAVALDTAGSAPDRLPDDVVAGLDVVRIDVKGVGRERHTRVTAADVSPTLAFARRVAEVGRPIVLRVVVVPGLTDDADDLSRLAAFAVALGTVIRVDVAPFRRAGRAVWEGRGLPDPLADIPGPTRDGLAAVRSVFEVRGLPVG